MESRFDVIPIASWGLFTEKTPLLIAGPCSAESEAQVLDTARRLHDIGVNVFRAGIWKPRTHPDTFEGVGSRGLDWLFSVRKETGMKVCTEVANARHVRECVAAGVDMVWIGARTTANPFLVQEIAEALESSEMPVLVKNPVSPDLDLWIGALERLARCGVKKLGVIHRGFSSFDRCKYRNSPEWQVAIELRSRFPELPFFCDPSHLSGDRRYIGEISQRALDLGLDGLMIESHCNPSYALSDARQQLTPSELGELMDRLTVRKKDADDSECRENIEQLRAKIDVIDENLLSALGARMELSRQIGEYKRRDNIAILQTSRWDAVLSKVIEKGAEYGLDKEFVTHIFNAIHEVSVSVQDEGDPK